MRGDSGYRSASMVSVNGLRSASVSSWVRSSCISESSHGHLFERGGRGDRLCAHTASRDRATPAGDLGDDIRGQRCAAWSPGLGSACRPIAARSHHRSSKQRLDPDKDERRRRERREQRHACQLLSRRQPCDEFEIVGDGVQVAARLIDLVQCRASVRLACARYARRGLLNR